MFICIYNMHVYTYIILSNYLDLSENANLGWSSPLRQTVHEFGTQTINNNSLRA